MEEINGRQAGYGRGDNMMEVQLEQIQELKDQIVKYNKQSNDKLEETSRTNRTFSEIVKESLKEVTTDVKNIQRAVEVTGIKINTVEDRQQRKNNIVAYRIPENEQNSKSKDKEDVIQK